MEARRKLEQDAAKFLRLNDRQDAFLEFINSFNSPFRFLMRELLPSLNGKFKVCRCALDPAFRCLRRARPVERGVDFNDIEVSRIELQLIRFRNGIKNTSP